MSGPSDGDAELVARARAGDVVAFGLLVSRHRRMVLSLLGRVLGASDSVPDAAQEATIRAMVSLDRLQAPNRFGAWYAGIALNVAREWLRSTFSAGPVPEEWADGRPGPADLAEAAETATLIRNAVATLAPGQRDAVLAFYWKGLTHAESSVELGISTGAVKARLHQARAVLGDRLSPHNESDKEISTMSGIATHQWVEVYVSEVRRSETDDPSRRRHVVVLQERGGHRQLPIWVGTPEATALACSLETVEMPRPMTYQFAAALAHAGGARISEVRITSLTEGTFYAVVQVQHGSDGEPAEVDGRPSDALNLALVTGAPVRVDATLFDHDPADAWRTAWKALPTATSQIVAEVQTQQADLRTLITSPRPETTTP